MPANRYPLNPTALIQGKATPAHDGDYNEKLHNTAIGPRPIE